nr:probable inactive ATP-dependent zinc metalloprotease FTSHI 2, chloroplastic [Tanacetum cinerariifolium]
MASTLSVAMATQGPRITTHPFFLLQSLRGRKNSNTWDETISRRGGILLYGPLGVGKTLLGKAVADAATLNVFLISASHFVEIYVGVGSPRERLRS